MNRAVLTVVKICVMAMVFLTGCQSQQKLDTKKCPPLASKLQAIDVFRNYRSSQKPLKASGVCNFKYKDENKKTVSLSVPVRLWIIDRDKYCIYGDVVFDPKALCLAVDNGRFWAYVKPMSLFMSGSVDAVITDREAGLFFNPAMLADFLSPITKDTDVVSIAKVSDGYTKVLCRNRSGKIKSVYLSACQNDIRKIDFIGRRRGESVYVSLDDYQRVDPDEEFAFPGTITFKNCPKDRCGCSMRMKLNSVKPWQPSSAQLEALFALPDTNSFQYKRKY